jgi:BirA family biotin operon repressor/biotin-[acetyl-CoA-carboxylase] ligase
MKFFQYESLGSTNVKAAELFAKGEKPAFWVRAEEQTAGRGRRGRDWVSPKGNFYGTACYAFNGTPQEAAKISFVAAIAVAKALQAYTLKSAPSLKWPNDVLLAGQKVAGLLLEAKAGHVLIGVGVNLVSHPDGGTIPATHLLEHIDPDVLNRDEPEFTGADSFLAILASAFDAAFRKHLAYGFSATRADWTALASGLPGPVTVRLPDESFTGQAQSLLENGALRVALPDGTIRDVHAGDVFFGSH